MVGLIFLCVFASAASAATPRPGTLDPSFGSGGSVISPLLPGAGYGDYVNAAAVEPDGVILVLGTNTTPTVSTSFVLDAFEPNGQPDTSFGDDGALQGPAGSSGDGIAVAASGEILLSAGLDDENEVVELNPDGTTNTGFGVDGAAQIGDSRPPEFADGAGLYLQPNGKILFTGQTSEGVCCGYGFVERLNASGSIDTSFGRDGRVLLGRPDLETTPPLVQMPNGDLMLGGGYPGHIVRLLPDGRHDPSFGHDGQIHLPTILITALAQQRGGKILVADQQGSGHQPGFLFRLTPDGSLDPQFGDRGRLTEKHAPGHAGYPTALAVQHDGAIIYADGNKVVRLNRNGATDLSFGQAGVSTLPLGTPDTPNCDYHVKCLPFSSSVDVALLPGNRILDVGGIGEYDPAGVGGIDLLLSRVTG